MQIGDLIFGSGNTSMDRETGHVFTGQLGRDIDMDLARDYAQKALVNALTALKLHLGDLSRIKRVVRLTGFVNSTSEFIRQPEVIHAASELLLEVFGEQGKHARSAIGVSQLPGGAAVEIELIVQVVDEQ